jgi:protocatechuate 3,4-dioxygenase beta subunit
MRTSLGTGNTAEGVPFTLEMTLVNINSNCAPLAGYTVYAWHCNRDGDYSMYSNAVVDEDYLRAAQAAGSDGVVKFTSIFPGCYLGRWPHIHFEVYPSLEAASTAQNAVLTSQIALTEAACQAAYATAGYETSTQNLPQITLNTDNVFSDGVDLQLATMTGDATNGYTAKITVGIAA